MQNFAGVLTFPAPTTTTKKKKKSGSIRKKKGENEFVVGKFGTVFPSKINSCLFFCLFLNLSNSFCKKYFY